MSLKRLSESTMNPEQALTLFSALVLQLHQAKTLDELFLVTVQQTRTLLQSDRLCLCQRLPNGMDRVVAEAIQGDWRSRQGDLYDPQSPVAWSEPIQAQLVVPIAASVTPHIEELSSAPDSPLCWGTLVVLEHGTPRTWQSLEIELVQQIALHLGSVIHRFSARSLESCESQRIWDQLAAQQAFLTQIINAVPSSIFVKDRDGYFLVANQASATVHGTTMEAMIGHREPDFNPNMSHAQYEEFLLTNQAVMQSGQPQRKIQQITTATGELRWYQTVIRPFLNPQGEVQGVVGNAVDITELKHAETALQEKSQRLSQIIAMQQDTETRYSSVITVMAEGIVLQHSDGQIMTCNTSAEQLLGLTRDQMQGLRPRDPNWWAIREDGTPFSEEDHPTRVVLSTGQPQSDVVMGVHKPDDTFSWIAINSQPLFHAEQTQPYAVVTSFRDITLLKQTEVVLRQQAERERMIHMIAHTIRQSLDLDHVLNTTVTQVRQFLQTDRVIIYRFNADWSGVVVTESVAPGWRSLLSLKISDTYFVENQSQTYPPAGLYSTPDIYTAGLSSCHIELLEQLQVRAKLVVPIWQEGTLWGLLVAHHCSAPRDWQPLERELLMQLATQVTIAIQQSQLYQQVQHLNSHLELQVQERTTELRQSLNFEALLKRITDSVRDSLDEQQILQTAVHELARGLNIVCCDTGIYNSDQTVSTIAYEFTKSLTPVQGKTVALADSAHANVYFYHLLQGRHTQFCDIAPNSLRSDQFWLSVLACPIRDDQGILGDLWLFKHSADVFNDQEVRLVQQVANQCAIALRQSRLYQSVQDQVKELERLNQLKDDFLCTISHELRTPISIINNAIQMLEFYLKPLGLLTDPAHPIARYLKVAQDECRQEISFINDLLNFNRLDAGEEPLNPTLIPLQFFIPHLVESFIERCQNHHQTLVVVIPPDLPGLVTDMFALERILTELLHNACKYTPHGETIQISAQRNSMALNGDHSDSMLQICVSNSGIEIPITECDRIFDKFYRIPNNDPWKHGGTGLGLALVKKLVEILQGQIQVKSAHQWTTFSVVLPLSMTSPVKEPK